VIDAAQIRKVGWSRQSRRVPLVAQAWTAPAEARPNWRKGNSGTTARRADGIELSDFARSPRDPNLFDESGEVVPAFYPAHAQLWNRVIGV
jgi:hypothetical protein